MIARLGEEVADGVFLADNGQPYTMNADGVIGMAAGVCDENSFELGERAFLGDPHGVTLMAHSGQPAPGGGTFGVGAFFPRGLQRGPRPHGADLIRYRDPVAQPDGRRYIPLFSVTARPHIAVLSAPN